MQLCSEDEVGVLVDEGDDFVVVLGFLVVGAVALEDVAVGEGQFDGFEWGVRSVDESGGEDEGVLAVVVCVGEDAVMESVSFFLVCINAAEDYYYDV